MTKRVVGARTKGQIEAAISNGFIGFEREIMGRGPTETKTYIIHDMVLVRLRGVLTPAETRLVELEGVELLKQVRTKLIEASRMLAEQMIQKLTGCSVVSMHADLSTKTGERVIVFVLSDNLEARLS